jgi:autotransporter-associated beta strand protein
LSGTATGDADTATFTGTGSTITDSVTNRELGAIVFNNAGSLGNFTIGSSSNTIYFNDTTSVTNISVLGTSTSGLTETIASNLMATGTTTTPSTSSFGDIRITTADGFTGTLKIAGNISTTATSNTSVIKVATGASTSTTENGNVIWLSGVISDNGSGKVALYRADTGVLILSGANTFSGGYANFPSSPAGIVEIGVNSVGSVGNITSSAFGTGAVTFEGGTVESDGLSARTIYNNVTLSGGTTNIYGFGDTTNTGALTFAGTFSMGSNLTGVVFQVNSGVTISGALSNSSNAPTLVKTGTGTLVLSGANTYSGTTAVQNGAISIATINNDASGTQAASSSLGKTATGASTLLKQLNGEITLGTTTTTGTLVDTGSGETSNRLFTLGGAGGGTIDQSGTGALVLSGAVSGVVGSGGARTLTLQGSTAGTGQISGVISDAATSVSSTTSATSSAGATTLSINNASALFGIGATISGTDISNGTTITAITGNTVTISNAVLTGGVASGATISATGSSGATALTKTGTGTWTLSGNNTFTGGVTINNGGLAIPTLNTVGSAQPLGEAGTVTLAGASSSAPAVLQYTGGTATLAQNVTVNTSSYGTISNSGSGVLTLSGTLSKSGSVLNLSTGKIVVTGTITGSAANSDLNVINGATVGLTTANTYNGPTGITGGSTLLTGINGALPTGTLSPLTLGTSGDSGTNVLDLLGTSQTVASIAVGSGSGATNEVISTNGSASGTPGSGTGPSSATGTLTVNYSGSSTDTYTGSLGAGTLNNFTVVKSGSGVLSLTGTNNYSGGTSVSAGTLLASSTAATGSGTLSVTTGATLGGYGTSSGTSFSISGSGTATGTTANLLAGLTSPSDTNVTQVLTLKASGVSTIQDANLTFNLNSSVAGGLGTDPANSGTELSVSTTKITFGAGVSLTLNLQNNSIITANTPYVLIAGTGSGSGLNGSQYSGLGSGGLDANNNIIITGLTLSFGGSQPPAWYNNSYLFLYQTAGGVDDIEVEVVPEPGTWALMVAGLAMLIFFQKRRKKS